MKTIFSLFFSVICFFGKAQIIGQVLNEKGVKLEYATIYNLTRRTSSITNSDGFFRLYGENGDSIRIQHVTHIASGFVINPNKSSYILEEKNIELQEIKVSPTQIIDLLERGCRNTYEKLAEISVSRVFYDFILVLNQDTAQVVNLDLDVIHKKKKKFDNGEIFKAYEISSSVRIDNVGAGKKSFKNYIGIPIDRFTWDKLIRAFSITKTEDPFDIIIYLNSKQSLSDSVLNWKFLISKEDSCFHEILMETTFPYVDRKKNIITEKNKYFQFAKYTSEKDKYYLDEIINTSSFKAIDKNGDISFTTHYKTYQHGENLIRRKKGKIIPNNYFNSYNYRE